MASELTLDAALRDSESPDPRSRNQAVRNLAAALLDRIGRPSPAWRAAAEHPQGGDVLTRLRAALDDDEQAPIRGLALVGLAQLGEPELIDYARLWVTAETPELDGPQDEDRVDGGDALPGIAGANAFLRECSVIALGLLGDAATTAAKKIDVASESEPVWSVADECRSLLTSCLTSEFDDVRFQACVSLAELGGATAQSAIVQAFREESVSTVRANQVAALSVFDPPSDASCGVLRDYLAEYERTQRDPALRKAQAKDEGVRLTSYIAALALAAARDRGGQGRLIESVEHTQERDRALEALAALGPPIADKALSRIRNVATNRLGPGMTRVRAAYAMCTLVPEEGQVLLTRLGRSWRPAVREAVADARVALELLERRTETES